MLRNLPSLTVVGIALIGISFGQTGSLKQTEHARWNTGLERDYGITQSLFTGYGLDRLTPEGMTGAVATAWLAGFKAANDVNDVKCGPSSAQPNLSKVKVVLAVSDGTPSEVASRLRQRVRDIRDAEIVFKDADADVTISVVGMENKLKSGSATGYTVSVVEYRPCRVTTTKGVFDLYLLLNHYVRLDSEANSIADSIVADFDAGTFEKVRQWNANSKSK